MTEPLIRFHVPGEPRGKGRPRAFKRGKHVGLYTDAKTAAYESTVALAAAEAMAGGVPFDGACALEIKVWRSIPKSWSAKKRHAALTGALQPTGTPDLDNCLKAVKDGCNGVVYRDDAQVTAVTARKRYGERPGVEVVVRADAAALEVVA